MADTYVIEKSLVMKKATGASKGQGDERDKAGDVEEDGEERATVTDEIKVKAGTTGDLKDKAGDVEEDGEKRAKPINKSETEDTEQGPKVVQSKPTPEQIAENSRQGNAGNERAQRFAAFKEQSRQRHSGEGRGLAVGGGKGPIAVEKSAIDAIVKSWGTSDKSLSFFKFFAKEDKELLKAMSVDKEAWKYYMDNHAKEVNKGIKEWE
jgi:hypothetical protein